MIPFFLLCLTWLLTMFLPLGILLNHYSECNEYLDANLMNITKVNMVQCKVDIEVPMRFNHTLTIPCHLLVKGSPKVIPILFNHRNPNNCMTILETPRESSWEFSQYVADTHWHVFILTVYSVGVAFIHGLLAEYIEKSSVHTENWLYMYMTFRPHLIRDMLEK